MLNAVAALALLWSLALPSDPRSAAATGVPYTEVLAAEAEATAAMSAEAEALMAEEPDWRLSARLYHAGGGGATGNDSLGCRPIALRTVAVDPNHVPRRTRLFIRETVGLPLPDGRTHDGFWYASDTGGAIRGAKIDLYTGHGRASMQPVMPLNMRTLTVVEAGRFEGCPPDWE